MARERRHGATMAAPMAPASPSATPEHIKDVNTRYHDAAAAHYDAKWGIDFGEIGQKQVLASSPRHSAASPARSATRSRSARAPATSASTSSRPERSSA